MYDIIYLVLLALVCLIVGVQALRGMMDRWKNQPDPLDGTRYSQSFRG